MVGFASSYSILEISERRQFPVLQESEAENERYADCNPVWQERQSSFMSYAQKKTSG